MKPIIKQKNWIKREYAERATESDHILMPNLTRRLGTVEVSEQIKALATEVGGIMEAHIQNAEIKISAGGVLTVYTFDLEDKSESGE